MKTNINNLILFTSSIGAPVSNADDPARIRAQRACEIAGNFKNTLILKNTLLNKDTLLNKNSDYSGLIWNPADQNLDSIKKGPFVFMAHSDTVYHPDFIENKETQNKETQNILKGPGIADNAYGMAFGLVLFEHLSKFYTISSSAPFSCMELLFTDGEEAAGNLRGARSRLGLLLGGKDSGPGATLPEMVIALEGTCFARISKRAWYIKRYEITFTGRPGRSSYPSVIDAAADFIAKINKLLNKSGPIFLKEKKFKIGFTGIKSPFLYNANPEEIKLNFEIRAYDKSDLDKIEKVLGQRLFNKNPLELVGIYPLLSLFESIKELFTFKKDPFKGFARKITTIDYRVGGNLFSEQKPSFISSFYNNIMSEKNTKSQFIEIISSSDANACIEAGVQGLVLFVGQAENCHSRDEQITIDLIKSQDMMDSIITTMMDLKWIEPNGK